MSKNILVTGTSSGFGKLIVETLAKDSHTVFATMRNSNGKNSEKAEAFKKYAADNNYNIHVYELDVTSDESVKNAVNSIVNDHKKIDVVVNNAGVHAMGLNESFTTDQMKNMYEVNVFGPFRVNNAVLPRMRTNKDGLLILISSLVGRIVIPFNGIYNSTKFAVDSLFEGYRYELGQLGIETAIIQPGAYPTEIFQNTHKPGVEELFAEYGPVTERFQKFGEAFGKVFEGEVVPNPQDIADSVKTLVDTPKGERPFRTTVDALGWDEGVKQLNELSENIHNGILTNFGIEDLTTVVK